MVTRADPTVLRMAGIGVPPWSARGIKQTLTPISQASNTKRDVNGTLHDVAFAGFRKYKSQISGADQQPPNVNGVWPGQEVVVDCVAELSYTTIGGSPARPVVGGSSRVEGLYTIFRPQITFIVITFQWDLDEYDRKVGWSFDVEEK